MRSLVLGGAGFIGSYLCEKLLMLGGEVVVYDAPHSDLCNLTKILDDVTVIKGDYIAEENFDCYMKDIDVVFHLISTSLPKNSNENIILDLDNNVRITLNLIESAVRCGIKKFVFFSSGGTVYGNSQSIPISEEHSTNPISAYGTHKLAIEKYIQLYGYLNSLDYRILRISNPYGERQIPFKGQGVIPTFLASAMLNKQLEVWGEGSIVRDYIYIQDVIDAVMEVIHYNGPHKVFNIGCGKGTSIVELIEIISNTIQREVKINYIASQKQDVASNVLNIDRIMNETKWQPQIDLSKGICLLYDNWKSLRFYC